MAQTEAQKAAKKHYEEKNRERTRYLTKRSNCRSFLRNNSTLEDLDEMEQIITERRRQLSE